MALIQLRDASLTLGGKRIMEGVNLRLGAGEHIGLVGPNGSGKTSLLRVLAREMELDGGTVDRKGGTRIGYLPQELSVRGGRTVLEVVRAGVPDREVIRARIAEVEREMAGAQAQGDAGVETITELAALLGDLHESLAQFETHFADHVALRILAGLGFAPDDPQRDMGELSGGWQMRAVLASLLFMQPDLLLMDEPTNHLDVPSVAWFARFLRGYRRTFVLISHDRTFLNEQIQRVVSFEPEGLRSYAGDYEHYLRQRQEERVVLENRSKNLLRERERTEAFIQRFRAQANKARAVQSRIKALAKMDEVTTLDRHQTATFRFPPTRPSSKQVLRTEGLTKFYGERKVFSGADLNILRGERIGVIGVNGAGKTTLLKVLAGEIEASAGDILWGHHVEPGYYAQHHTDTLDPTSTVLEEVARALRGASPTTVRTLLGALLFTGDDVEKPIQVLSGGERARVALARLLIKPTNLILMDEPTNHLDLDSSERLADALETYDGTLVFVSHNRSFLSRLATRIWNVADGRVENFPGTLDEYMASSLRRLDYPEAGNPQLEDLRNTTKRRTRNQDKDRKRREAEARNQRRLLLGPIETRMAKLEQTITELEAQQAERSALLADPDVYADAEQAGPLTRAYQTDALQIEELTAAWEKAAMELERATQALEETG